MYEIGQKVRVKSWDQMAKEYGVTDGTINTPSSFIPDMRCFCGKIYKIKAIYDPVHNIYDLETITGDEDVNEELLYYCWDEVMLEPITGDLEIMIKERRKCIDITTRKTTL